MSLAVIGAGLGRTGTASLRAALSQLDLPSYHMYDLLFDRRRRDDVQFWNSVAPESAATDWASVFSEFKAALDYPACFFWRELLATYPTAKVVLTTHPRGPDAWYDSTFGTIFADTSASDASNFGRAMVAMLDRHVWGRDGLFQGRFLDRDFALSRYEAHNATVRADVPANRLLDFNVTQGWAPICSALDIPVPDTPFPQVNGREENALMMNRLRRMKGFRLGTRRAAVSVEPPHRGADLSSDST